MKTNIKAIIIAVLLLICSGAYATEVAPPPRYPLDVAPSATLKSTPSSSLLLGTIAIIFDKTTLGEAMKKIKAGKIQQQGDAGESSYWLCYSIRTKAGWEQLWLLSHDEIGGDEHVISGVAAKMTTLAPSSVSCPALPDNLRPVKLNNGLWLGSQMEEIRQKLGKPSLQKNKWLYYQSQRELVGDPRAKDFGAEKIYELGSVSVRVVKGKVVEIWATKQTTD